MSKQRTEKVRRFFNVECARCKHAFRYDKDNAAGCPKCGSPAGVYKGVSVCIANMRPKVE